MLVPFAVTRVDPALEAGDPVGEPPQLPDDRAADDQADGGDERGELVDGHGAMRASII
jgi:hypothetical protein